MLSAQCEELRAMAESVGLAMPQAATLMMGAADAIDRLDADNAKLREERDMYRDLVGMMDHPDLNAQLQAENSKLRDLCEWLLNPYRLGAVTGEGVDRQWCRETYDGGSYRLRELGTEVDDARKQS